MSLPLASSLAAVDALTRRGTAGGRVGGFGDSDEDNDDKGGTNDFLGALL